MLADKGRPGDPYMLQVICERDADGWHTVSDSNGHGWTAFPSKGDGMYRGVLTLWGEAHPGAESVTVRWEGQTFSAFVTCGHYLFAAWDVPEDRSGDVPELASP